MVNSSLNIGFSPDWVPQFIETNSSGRDKIPKILQLRKMAKALLLKFQRKTGLRSKDFKRHSRIGNCMTLHGITGYDSVAMLL